MPHAVLEGTSILDTMDDHSPELGKSSKKRRHREEPDSGDQGRRHKKSKSKSGVDLIATEPPPEVRAADGTPSEKKKKKKKKEKENNGEGLNGDLNAPTEVPAAESEMPGAAEDRSGRRKSNKHRHQVAETGNEETVIDGNGPIAAKMHGKKLKKTRRESDAGETGTHKAVQRKSKKHSKGDDDSAKALLAEDSDRSIAKGGARAEKSKKAKKHQVEAPLQSADDGRALQGEEGTASRESSGEPPRRKKADKKKKKKRFDVLEDMTDDPMDVDRMTSKQSTQATATALRPAGAPENLDFPFFTQTVSLYLPFYPVGFDKPISSAIDQYLRPALNHYSQNYGGVLLGFSNVGIGRQERLNPQNPPTDRTPAVFDTIDSYAVGWGSMTADLDLFVPSRGAWMMGRVILQSEGHLGVLCWDRFNASIEAKRLPRGWRFVDLAAGDAQEEPLAQSLEDEGAENETREGSTFGAGQMHSTGYWVDGSGRRVKGNVLFRIKSYEVGKAGEQSWLSIEGTMLNEEEKEVLAEEMEAERRRKLRLHGSMLRRTERRVPEFSVTRFAKEDDGEEEDSGQRQELYKGSRPVTPFD